MILAALPLSTIPRRHVICDCILCWIFFYLHSTTPTCPWRSSFTFILLITHIAHLSHYYVCLPFFINNLSAVCWDQEGGPLDFWNSKFSVQNSDSSRSSSRVEQKQQGSRERQSNGELLIPLMMMGCEWISLNSEIDPDWSDLIEVLRLWRYYIFYLMDPVSLLVFSSFFLVSYWSMRTKFHFEFYFIIISFLKFYSWWFYESVGTTLFRYCCYTWRLFPYSNLQSSAKKKTAKKGVDQDEARRR